MTKSSQQRSILSALCKRWVTPIDALQDCGCFRLAARIHDLRGAGWQISDKWVETQTGARIKAYRIEYHKAYRIEYRG